MMQYARRRGDVWHKIDPDQAPGDPRNWDRLRVTPSQCGQPTGHKGFRGWDLVTGRAPDRRLLCGLCHHGLVVAGPFASEAEWEQRRREQQIDEASITFWEGFGVRTDH